MALFRADLHCHTICSDGSLSAYELLHLAKNVGLSGLAITDHDTIEAYQLAIPLAKEIGISLISGVEFSAAYQAEQVHILAYSFSLTHPAILKLCQEHIYRRQERNRQILALLAKRGMSISEDEVREQAIDKEKHKIYGRPHIALAMVKKRYAASIQEAFHLWLAEGRPCYAQGPYISVEQTLSVIQAACGKAVIAHPHLIKKSSVLESLFQMDFDGIEGYYPMGSQRGLEKWVARGRRQGWLITGGSDFHGQTRQGINLGCSFVEEPTFRILEAHFLQHAT